MSKPANTRRLPENELVRLVLDLLEELKAEAITSLDVRHLTSVTDFMVIANGRSSGHVKGVAAALVDRAKEKGYRPLGIEGETVGEWVLVDLSDVVVHLMMPTVREFYDLEKLWDIEALDEAEDLS
jgi:ribosome-associated protein